MVLDSFGGSNNVDVLIRSIDLHGTGSSNATAPFRALSREKILMFQAGVDGPLSPAPPTPVPAGGQKIAPTFPSQGGAVIMSSLKILELMPWAPPGSSPPAKGQPGYQPPMPEVHHLLQRLIDYACTNPHPRNIRPSCHPMFADEL